MPLSNRSEVIQPQPIGILLLQLLAKTQSAYNTAQQETLGISWLQAAHVTGDCTSSVLPALLQLSRSWKRYASLCISLRPSEMALSISAPSEGLQGFIQALH